VWVADRINTLILAGYDPIKAWGLTPNEANWVIHAWLQREKAQTRRFAWVISAIGGQSVDELMGDKPAKKPANLADFRLLWQKALEDKAKHACKSED
jgi:hypothetical protein